MPGLQVLTFGCRLNIVESEAMRGLAAGTGDAIIVNTCAVTAEAERQGRQAIRRARREHPDTPIIVTGCAAELRPESFAAMPEVTRVLGNRAKLDPASWGRDGAIPAPDPTAGFVANTRGFLEVQHGCDHRCTFCVIPLARGPSRSVPVGEAVAGVRRLVAAGHWEVVLTGVDLTAWGGDLPERPALGDLVAQILRDVPELARLRLSSVDPAEIDAALWHVFETEERLMPHLHLSVQAGDDKVLKQMKRRHLRADVIAVAERARRLRPEVALGADLIAGFPTETDAAFEAGLDLIAAAGLTHLHVFPYSARPGTPAAKLPGLPGPIIRERAARLRAAGAAALRAFLDARIGAEATILMERDGTGLTPDFARVRPDQARPSGTLARVRITGRDQDHLIGDCL